MGKYIQYIEGSIGINQDESDFDALSNQYLEDKILSVINMFNFYMDKKILGKGINKINIIFINNFVNNLDCKVEFGQAHIFIKTDFSIFRIISTTQSREKIIIFLLKGIEKIAGINDIDIGSFYKTYLKIKELDYIFETNIFKFSKDNPIKTLSGNIYFKCTDIYEVFIQIKDKSTSKKQNILLNHHKLFQTNESLFFFYKKIEWINDYVLKITHSNNRDYWLLDLQKNKLEFIYPRAEQGDAHGQYDLALMYLNGEGVLKDEQLGYYWLKKSAEQNFKRAIKMLNG